MRRASPRRLPTYRRHLPNWLFTLHHAEHSHISTEVLRPPTPKHDHLAVHLNRGMIRSRPRSIARDLWGRPRELNDASLVTLRLELGPGGYCSTRRHKHLVVTSTVKPRFLS
jgi:hypothetical protein